MGAFLGMESSYQTFLHTTIHLTRQRVLTVVQAALGDTHQWNFVRSQILDAFGSRGMEGEFEKFFTMEQRHGDDQSPKFEG
jgi:hypothetical protein